MLSLGAQHEKRRAIIVAVHVRVGACSVGSNSNGHFTAKRTGVRSTFGGEATTAIGQASSQRRPVASVLDALNGGPQNDVPWITKYSPPFTIIDHRDPCWHAAILIALSGNKVFHGADNNTTSFAEKKARQPCHFQLEIILVQSRPATSRQFAEFSFGCTSPVRESSPSSMEKTGLEVENLLLRLCRKCISSIRRLH